MICVSFGENNFEKLSKVIAENSLVELRLDKIDISKSQLDYILLKKNHLILTNRKLNLNNDEIELLVYGIENGADYIDLDINLAKKDFDKLLESAKKNNCSIIISYHNYEFTPENEYLIQIKNKCFHYQPQIIKIACKSNSQIDNSRLMSLYSNNDTESSLIIIGMGVLGRITRIASIYLGAPFTYAKSKESIETAEGQFDEEYLKQILSLING